MKNEEYDDSIHCLICDWPINRVIKKDKVNEFCSGIIKWLEAKKIKNREKIIEKIRALMNKDAYLCRYDFFYLIRDFIKEYNPKAAKVFEEKIAKQFDFNGAMVS